MEKWEVGYDAYPWEQRAQRLNLTVIERWEKWGYASPEAVGKVTGEELYHLVAKAKGRCYWCGIVCKLGGRCSSRSTRPCLTFDHLMPLYRGGLNIIQNLVVACYRCNTSRGNHDIGLVRPKST